MTLIRKRTRWQIINELPTHFFFSSCFWRPKIEKNHTNWTVVQRLRDYERFQSYDFLNAKKRAVPNWFFFFLYQIRKNMIIRARIKWCKLQFFSDFYRCKGSQILVPRSWIRSFIPEPPHSWNYSLHVTKTMLLHHLHVT